jgi:hypothetical protein
MSTHASQSVPVPVAVRTYLTAHADRDVGAALRVFSPTAVVTDQGSTFRGTEAIEGFLRDAGSEYTYTAEEHGVERVDESHWVVAIRLTGDFPGGVADVHYRFTVLGDLVAELSIG